MNIAFLGGCVNRQKDLAHNAHHHFILRNKLQQATSEMPNVVLHTYQSYLQLSATVRQALNAPVDVLVLFIRPFPLHPLIKPVIRYADRQNKKRLSLHPAFGPKLPVENMMDEFAAINSTNANRGATHKMLARLNVFAGRLTGLPGWTVNHILQQITEVIELCSQKNIKLIIAGPPPYPTQKHIDNLCALLDKRITRLAAENGVVHASLLRCKDESGNNLLGPDGIHLTAAGHEYFAGQVFNTIRAWQQ